MSLYHRSKGYRESYDRKRLDELFDPCANDEKHMSIPSVIIVPRRQCRVTSIMAKHFRDMLGEEISPVTAAAATSEGRSKAKPWQVDMARKSYTSSSRRFRKPSRRRQSSSSVPSLPPDPLSSPLPSVVACTSPQESLEMDGSWNNKEDDNSYPSDEENGFGGGLRGRGNSPAGSAHSGGSSFGGVVLKGFYGVPRSSRNRRV